MPLGRTYTVDSGIMADTTAAATPLFCGTTVATSTMYIEAIRFSVVTSGASVYPANATLAVGLFRATGTAAGGAAVTPNPHISGDLAARSTWLSVGATPTAITGLTQGSVQLWGMTLPFTAGANWAEWVTPGNEWSVPISANIALYLVQSTAGTLTNFQCEMVFSE